MERQEENAKGMDSKERRLMDRILRPQEKEKGNKDAAISMKGE